MLEEAEAMYARLVEVYPKDIRFLRKYAEILDKAGKTSQARQAWRRLHALLLGAGDAEAARTLEKRFPWLVGDELSVEPVMSGLLASFEDRLALRIVRRMRERRLKENEMLFRAGDPGDALYVVLEGRLMALGPAADGETPVVLNILRRGDVVGELAMLRGAPRSADVVAASPARLLELSRKHLMRLVGQSEAFHERLGREAEMRHRVTQISRNGLLARLPLEERRRLAEEARPCRAPARTLLCEGGGLIGEVRLVTKGVADVIYEDRRGTGHWLHDIRAGDMIGEAAILGDAAFPADVVAATDVEWLALPLPVLRDMFAAHAGLRLRLEKLVETHVTNVMGMVRRIRKVRDMD